MARRTPQLPFSERTCRDVLEKLAADTTAEAAQLRQEAQVLLATLDAWKSAPPPIGERAPFLRRVLELHRQTMELLVRRQATLDGGPVGRSPAPVAPQEDYALQVLLERKALLEFTGPATDDREGVRRQIASLDKAILRLKSARVEISPFV